MSLVQLKNFQDHSINDDLSYLPKKRAHQLSRTPRLGEKALGQTISGEEEDAPFNLLIFDPLLEMQTCTNLCNCALPPGSLLPFVWACSARPFIMYPPPSSMLSLPLA